MKDFIYLLIMIIFLSPLVAIPLFSGTVIVLKLHEVIKDFWLDIELRKYKPSKKEQNPDLLSAERDGFSPNLKITPKELLANHETLTLERVKDIGQVIYPQRYWQFVNGDESIADKDTQICSLFLQMSFIREFIIKTEPKLWSRQSEEKWVYHCPKGLRKLKPDFYNHLLVQVREKDRHSQFN